METPSPLPSSPPVSSVQPSASTFPARHGSSVLPLVDGNPTFQRLCELIVGAKASVWIAVSFIDVERWRAPDGSSFFELLSKSAHKGIDVRILFWRLEFENPVLCKSGNNFFGTGPQRALLEGSGLAVRWDSSGPDHRHCHHEKSWIIDGCTVRPVGVQGGIVITTAEMCSPGHPAEEVLARRCFHDVNVEVRGQAAGDLARHFVQRWNAAHGHQEPHGHWPDLTVANDLYEPPEAEANGDLWAQVLRTLRPGQLGEATEGEASILEYYREAMGRARNSIYIENQHIAHPELLGPIYQACERGVKVVYLVPAALLTEHVSWRRTAAQVDSALSTGFGFSVTSTSLQLSARALRFFWPAPPAHALDGPESSTPSYEEAFLYWVPRLAQHPNFCLAGLHVQADVVRSVYVHSKLIIVDDRQLLVGSANLVDLSLEKDHTELAVAAWGKEAARALRDALFEEHTGLPVPEGGGPAAPIEWLAALARGNAERLAAGQPLVGRIAEIDGRLYGTLLFAVSMAVERAAARGAARRKSFD